MSDKISRRQMLKKSLIGVGLGALGLSSLVGGGRFASRDGGSITDTFTEDSVIFMGANDLDEDNANFSYDKATQTFLLAGDVTLGSGAVGDTGFECFDQNTHKATVGWDVSANAIVIADGIFDTTHDIMIMNGSIIDFRPDNDSQMIMGDGIFYPTVNNDLDIGDLTHKLKDTWTHGRHYLRDAAIHISSATDGDADIQADVGIDLNIGANNEVRIVANQLIFNNGAVDTGFGWASSGAMGLQVGGAAVFAFTATQFYPAGDNVRDLGQSIARWKDIWQIGKHHFRDVAIGIYSQADSFLDLFADGAVRIGDSSAGAPTNYSRFDSDGGLTFVGTAGLGFGSCYGNHIGWVQANAVQNTWYNISDADMVSGQLNKATHDGNGELTVTEAGRYLISWSCCFEDDTANDHIEAGIEVSGSGSANAAGQAHLENKFANEEEHMSSSCILDLSDNATIEVAIRTTDAGTPTISVQAVNISCVQVGGT